MRISDIWYYVQGNVRYWLHRRYGNAALRPHIRQQIMMRYKSCDSVCLNYGHCRICGCSMPALMYADKSCDKPCYPRIMCFDEWIGFVFNHGNSEWILTKRGFRKVHRVYE